jgi:hypothetical protein
MVTHRTIFLAGTPSTILDMDGGGTQHLSVTTRDLYGVATAKLTFAALIRFTAGTLVTAM